MSLEALIVKFCGGLPAGRLLVNGGADDAFVGPRHQVWRRDPCDDAAGQQQRRQHLWLP